MPHPSPVTIRLVLLARLRESLATSEESIGVAAGSRVVDLIGQLRDRGGAWATELAPGRAVRVAINHEMAGNDAPLRQGDEVALFPPVTGG